MRNFAVIAMCTLAAFAAAQDRAKGAAIVGFPETIDSFTKIRENTHDLFFTGNPEQMLENAERLGLHIEVQDGYYLIVELESLIPYRKLLIAQIVRAAFLEPDIRIRLSSLSPAQRNLVADFFKDSREPTEISIKGNGLLEISPSIIIRMNTDDGPVDIPMHMHVERDSVDGVEYPESPIGRTTRLTNEWWNYSVREILPIQNPVEGHTAYQEMLKKVIYDLEQEAEDTMSEISHIAQQVVTESLSRTGHSPNLLRIGATLPDSFHRGSSSMMLPPTVDTDPLVMRMREIYRLEEEASKTGTLASVRITFHAELHPVSYFADFGLVSVPLYIGGG